MLQRPFSLHFDRSPAKQSMMSVNKTGVRLPPAASDMRQVSLRGCGNDSVPDRVGRAWQRDLRPLKFQIPGTRGSVPGSGVGPHATHPDVRNAVLSETDPHPHVPALEREESS